MSLDLRGNRELVMTAVTQWGMPLQYACEELKGDVEVVLAAIYQNSLPLEFASQESIINVVTQIIFQL